MPPQVTYFNCDTGTSIKRNINIAVKTDVSVIRPVLPLLPHAPKNSSRNALWLGFLLFPPQAGTHSFVAPVYIRQLAVYVYRTDLRPGDPGATTASPPVTTTTTVAAPVTTTTTASAGVTTTTTTATTTTQASVTTTTTQGSGVFPAGTRFAPLYRINAGGEADYTDGLGRVWAIDDGYISGQAYSIDTDSVNPGVASLDVVYASERNGARGSTMAYRLNVGGATAAVRVRLHFCELLDTSARVGDRIMDVYVEGKLLRSNFDSVAEFGYRVGGFLSFDVLMAVRMRKGRWLHTGMADSTKA